MSSEEYFEEFEKSTEEVIYALDNVMYNGDAALYIDKFKKAEEATNTFLKMLNDIIKESSSSESEDSEKEVWWRRLVEIVLKNVKNVKKIAKKHFDMSSYGLAFVGLLHKLQTELKKCLM